MKCLFVDINRLDNLEKIRHISDLTTLPVENKKSDIVTSKIGNSHKESFNMWFHYCEGKTKAHYYQVQTAEGML
jgi:hypothetical protein